MHGARAFGYNDEMVTRQPMIVIARGQRFGRSMRNTANGQGGGGVSASTVYARSFDVFIIVTSAPPQTS